MTKIEKIISNLKREVFIFLQTTRTPLTKILVAVLPVLVLLTASNQVFSQSLKLNDSEYFEMQGVNVMVFSSQYNGMFFDEKTAAIEIIQHGNRISTGGAIRLQNT